MKVYLGNETDTCKIVSKNETLCKNYTSTSAKPKKKLSRRVVHRKEGGQKTPNPMAQ
jgi:hypothetical protein